MDVARNVPQHLRPLPALLLNPDTNLKRTSGQDPRPLGWLRRPGAQPDAGGAVDVARNVPQHLRPLPAPAKP